MEIVRLRRFDAIRRSRRVVSNLMRTDNPQYRLRRLEKLREETESQEVRNEHGQIMARIEAEQDQTGINEAIAFSRTLPQMGVHPEIILQAALDQMTIQ